jgi:hypothetical protein
MMGVRYVGKAEQEKTGFAQRDFVVNSGRPFGYNLSSEVVTEITGYMNTTTIFYYLTLNSIGLTASRNIAREIELNGVS